MQEFIEDLHLSVGGQPFAAGEEVSFFVQGEPPTHIRVGQYLDVLAAGGEALYRLESARGRKRAIRYPLPADYLPPRPVRLQRRQRVALPAKLPPGRYTLRATLFTGKDYENERATPEKRIRLRAPE